MVRHDHGDSYSPWYDHGKIMAWTIWRKAWSFHGHHGHYNVVRMLIMQPILFNNAQLVAFNLLTWNMLKDSIKNYGKDIY